MIPECAPTIKKPDARIRNLAADGLDQAEDALGVPALEFLRPAGRRELQGKGGDKLTPPLEGFAQIRISFAHFLPIIGRIGGIRQGGDDVGDDKPPLIVVHRVSRTGFIPTNKCVL